MKGTLIKQHRKFKNMTLEELASGICSVSYLSKIEHNTINASDEIYRLLGQRLNIKLTDINQDFDERIYQDLLEWHEAAQMRDFPLMKKMKEKCRISLEDNKNILLVNLFNVILVRHEMTMTGNPIPEQTLKELKDIVQDASSEYRFFFYKTVGIHYLLQGELREALRHFREAKRLMSTLPWKEGEVYYHLALTYSKTRSYVESTYYAFLALEEYKSSLHYSRMVDNYIIIAINYNSLGVLEIAEEFLHKVLKVAKYHLPPVERRRIYHNLGTNYIYQEKYDLAFEYLNKAYEIPTEERDFISGTIYLLALTSYQSGDMDLCKQYIRDGEIESEKDGLLKFQHKFYILKNRIHGKTRDDAFIDKLENEIIPDFRRLNEYKDYKEAVEMLANLYYQKRMYKKAATYYKEANNYKLTQKADLV
ncbi:helix-turn-helix domain-containing protein [Bacillus sp. SB49]|uniref:tetratricopeptide repeat protein n=1 Tax=Bacillus sp. SB49 TaxID=1071080 RepID=UPI00040F97C8|nr:tetratricopeptide repeat protein [Bacillus sp. SB49]QHT48319.1 helix-turn-helix domain-containing protein [Bacillus sp. SB49]